MREVPNGPPGSAFEKQKPAIVPSIACTTSPPYFDFEGVLFAACVALLDTMVPTRTAATATPQRLALRERLATDI